jgi:hypothetical protein
MLKWLKCYDFSVKIISPGFPCQAILQQASKAQDLYSFLKSQWQGKCGRFRKNCSKL